jgi:hypothetical protein
MVFAQTWRSDQGQRARLLDERGIQIAQDHLALQLRSEAEVELLERGGEGKTGLPHPLLRRGVGARGAFFLEQSLQEIGVAQFLVGGTVQPLRQHAGRLMQAEMLQHWLQTARRAGRHTHRGTPAATGTSASSEPCGAGSGVQT